MVTLHHPHFNLKNLFKNPGTSVSLGDGGGRGVDRRVRDEAGLERSRAIWGQCYDFFVAQLSGSCTPWGIQRRAFLFYARSQAPISIGTGCPGTPS
jgi:hypothetical protein